jgi:hypothetical protein
MAFVEEPGQATTSGGQNDKGKAPAFSTEVSHAYEAQSDGENENERLLLFSDGIIAFTITLATISIRLPSDKPIAELPNLLTDLYPNLITYLIGFVIVGSYWYEHWLFLDTSNTAQQHWLFGTFSFWRRSYFCLSFPTIMEAISI